MPCITVTIATSSAAELRLLRSVLATDRNISVIAECPGLMETFTAIENHPPDVVLISRDLTLSPEFELMRSLFEVLDLRWLVIDRSTAGRAGVYPSFEGHAVQAQSKGGDLFTLDATASPAGFVRQIYAVSHASRRAVQIPPATARAVGSAPEKLVLIGASTGGVDALVSVLSTFPANCPPTVVVQHTGKGFGQGLVQILSLRCRARVVPCADGLELTSGMVCIAAGTPGHAVFAGFKPLRLSLIPGDPVSGHMPSIDRLFHSAVPFARRSVAVILTGMGSDGAAGLLALRNAGASTIAQDAATSVVYGMPRMAWENGGAERQLPLNRVGPALLQQSRLTA